MIYRLFFWFCFKKQSACIEQALFLNNYSVFFKSKSFTHKDNQFINMKDLVLRIWINYEHNNYVLLLFRLNAQYHKKGLFFPIFIMIYILNTKE